MKIKEVPFNQKLEIVLAVLKGTYSIEVATRKFGVSPQSIHRWRNQFLQGGMEALKNGKKGKNLREKELERELMEAKRVIAEQAIALEVLKKIHTPEI